MKIIKEFRRTMVMTINENGEVIVKAPLFLSERKINKFIESKSNWIAKQQIKIQQKKEVFSKYDFENKIYLNGIGYNWEEIKKNNKMTKSSFYTKYFYNEIVKKVQKYGNLEVKLCNSKTIWGSCNINKTIKLNWKIIILPENLQNYIIIHEISHLKEMNHSKQFWYEVEKLDPEYKKNRKDLKEYSFLLKESIL